MGDTERREQIRKRVAKATAGEWFAEEGSLGWTINTRDGDEECWLADLGAANGEADAAIMAHAPADLAWLDKRLTEVERERDEIRALLIKAEQDLGDYCDTLEKAEQRIAELETDRQRGEVMLLGKLADALQRAERLTILVGNLVGVLDEVLIADEAINNALLDNLPSGSGPLRAVLDDARAAKEA